MDYRKKALILDGATDLYTLIRDILGIARSDDRGTQLDLATEAYLKQVLALEDHAPSSPQLELI